MATKWQRLHDSALFWLGLGGAVAVIGGILMGIGGSRTAAGASLWASRWFLAGFVVTLVGALMLLWSLVLFLAHRHSGHADAPPSSQVVITGGVTHVSHQPATISTAMETAGPVSLLTLPPPDPGFTRVYVSDLVKEYGLIISGRRFQSVELVGPAVITLMGTGTLSMGTFHGDSPEDMFFEYPADRQTLVGVVAFQNCEFRNFQMRAIAFAGSPELIAHIREGLGF